MFLYPFLVDIFEFEQQVFKAIESAYAVSYKHTVLNAQCNLQCEVRPYTRREMQCRLLSRLAQSAVNNDELWRIIAMQSIQDSGPSATSVSIPPATVGVSGSYQRTVCVAAMLWPTIMIQSVKSISVYDPGWPSLPKLSRIDAAAVAVQRRVLPSLFLIRTQPECNEKTRKPTYAAY